MKINAFTMQYEIWKGRKKSLTKAGIEPGSIASKDILARIYRLSHWSWCVSATLLLTDISSSQRWVIYSQTNGAASNYTYLSGLSDLSLCFLTCFVFRFAFVLLFSSPRSSSTEFRSEALEWPAEACFCAQWPIFVLCLKLYKYNVKTCMYTISALLQFISLNVST